MDTGVRAVALSRRSASEPMQATTSSSVTSRSSGGPGADVLGPHSEGHLTGKGSPAVEVMWSFETPGSSTHMDRVSTTSRDTFAAHVAAHVRENPAPQSSAWGSAVLDFSELDAAFQLPVTASRNARWYATSFHCITAMVGAGLLALPSAMARLGWATGAFLLVLCWAVTLYSLWQLAFLHEFDGRRFNRYHELGQYTFGRRAGLWIVVPFQLTVMVGLGIVYSLTAGEVLRHVWALTCREPCRPLPLSGCMAIFGLLQIVLSQVPNFNALRWLSLLSAVMSIGFSTMVIVACVWHGRERGATYNTEIPPQPPIDKAFKALATLGTLSFAYGGHNIVLEIQATLPSPPPTLRPMMKGVYMAYAFIAYCYLGVAFSGYWAFGQLVESNILFSILRPQWIMIAIDITVIVNLCGKFQIYSMPVFDMIETVMVRQGVSNSVFPRLGYRTAYVIVVGVVGFAVPFIEDLMAVIGALAFGPTTFMFPSIMYLKLMKPSYRDIHFSLSWTNIVVGLVVTLLGTVGGARNLRATSHAYYFSG